MPVPIPGLKVGSDTQKVKFLTIFGRPKTGIFHRFRGVLGRAPLATNHADQDWYCATVVLFDSWLLTRDPKHVVPFRGYTTDGASLLAATGLGTVRSRAIVHRGPC